MSEFSLLKDWMRTRISKLELAALGEEEKTRLTGELDQFSAECQRKNKAGISK